jgi:hypothetical protein
MTQWRAAMSYGRSVIRFVVVAALAALSSATQASTL